MPVPSLPSMIGGAGDRSCSSRCMLVSASAVGLVGASVLLAARSWSTPRGRRPELKKEMSDADVRLVPEQIMANVYAPSLAQTLMEMFRVPLLTALLPVSWLYRSYIDMWSQLHVMYNQWEERGTRGGQGARVQRGSSSDNLLTSHGGWMSTSSWKRERHSEFRSHRQSSHGGYTHHIVDIKRFFGCVFSPTTRGFLPEEVHDQRVQAIVDSLKERAKLPVAERRPIVPDRPSVAFAGRELCADPTIEVLIVMIV